MRTTADILAALDPAVAAELRAAIGLDVRTASNRAWAESRREYQRREDEHATALADALAAVRLERQPLEAQIAEVSAERDRLAAELERIRTPGTGLSEADRKALADIGGAERLLREMVKGQVPRGASR